MKKFLALVLALVMTMSLVTISAGAEDFTDADKVTYSEAVDVMTAIEVVGGYADGSFNPTAGLTRGAAAKIICNMILGPTTAEALSANDAPFADVAVDNVFAGYIAYCANEGIISGYADGTFRPAAPLTGYAFMKMLLGALGYDAVNEGYVGSNWSIAVAKRALNIGLDAGLEGDFVGAKALTREEACLYAFNTLKGTMVEYKNDSKITVGDIVVSNSSKAEEVTRTEAAGVNYAGDQATDAGKGTLQFCEKYFKTLKLDATDKDGYCRPAVSWDYKSEDVGTYALEPDFVYVNEFDKDVKEDLEYDDYKFDNVDVAGEELYYNGAKWQSNLAYVMTSASQAAKNGYTVELYDTNDDKIFDCAVVIEAYFAMIDEFTAATTTRDAKVTVKVMEVGANIQTVTVTDDPKKDTDMYDKLTAFEEGDFVSVIMKPQWDQNLTSGASYMKAVAELEAVAGTISRVNAAAATGISSVIMDGVTYNLNNEFMAYNQDAKTAAAGKTAVAAADEGTLYLDAQGCVVAFVADKTATNDKHMAVTDVYQTLVDDKLVTKVEGVITTGETATFTIEGTAPKAYDATEQLYVYADADEDGLYEFSVESTFSNTNIADNAKKLGSAYFAKDVKFIFIDRVEEEVTVLEGVQEVKSTDYYAVKTTINGVDYVEAVYVLSAPAAGVTSADIIFVNTSDGNLSLDTDENGVAESYVKYNAYVEGEKVEDFYIASTDSKGAYSFFKSVKSSTTGAYKLTGNHFVDTTTVGTVVGTVVDGDYVANANTITVTLADSSTVVLGTADANIVDVSTNENGISYATDVAVIYDKETMEASIIYVTVTAQ